MFAKIAQKTIVGKALDKSLIRLLIVSPPFHLFLIPLIIDAVSVCEIRCGFPTIIKTLLYNIESSVR